MAVNLSPVGGVAAQFFTSTGAVLTGGKLYTYAAGTTTPVTTYTTSQGNVAWTNPVELDAAGRVPGSGEIWLTDGVIYKFVLKDSNDVLIATYDNITGINSNAIAYTNQQEIVTATAGQTVFNLGISYAPGTNSLSVFVDGVNQYGSGAQYSYVETSSTSVTFNSGLHVGAEVKFTTTQQQGAGAVDASQVTYDPPFTGSAITNVENKLAQTVSVQDFGAVGDGVTDDTAAIQAAIDTGHSVYFPDGQYLSGPLTATNSRLYGTGTLVGSSAVASATLITAINTTIEGISINSGTYTLYGISGGNYTHVKGVTFSGNYGHCVLLSGAQSSSIVDCVLKEGGNQTTPFVVSSCIDTLVADNIIEEHTGFGIQTRFSTQTTIANNVIKQRYFSQSFTASASTETFSFTTGRSCERFSAFSGTFKTITSTTQVSSTQYNVTVTGLTPGAGVTIYGFVGLESIQANSGCNSVSITGNSVFHSGDSGILCGADYHWNGSAWVLDPGAVVESDYPRYVTINGNTIVGPILAAGIALNNVVGATVTSNTISDVGYTELDSYRSGISCAYIVNTVLRDNITDGTNTHTYACVKYTGQQTFNANNTFGFNRGIGCSNYEFFANSDPSARRYGYNIVDAKVDDLITRSIETMLDGSWSSGAYTGNNINVAISGGTGISKSASNTYAYWTSIRTYASEYAELYIASATLNLFANKLVEVVFYAKADAAGDSGYLSLYYQFPGDDANPAVSTTITNTTWQKFTVTMALGAMTSLFVRMGSSTGVVWFSRLRIDALDVQ